MPPIRSISPDCCRRGVRPKAAPTAFELLKRKGTSTVAKPHRGARSQAVGGEARRAARAGPGDQQRFDDRGQVRMVRDRSRHGGHGQVRGSDAACHADRSRCRAPWPTRSGLHGRNSAWILEIRASSAGPARTSATIALRVSLSSKATTSGGRLNSMHLRDYCGSAREAALNMFDWRSLLEKSE
jgi:hypothetical protein